MTNIESSSAPSFCADLHIFVKDFSVPRFDKEGKKGPWLENRLIRYFSHDNKCEVKGISGDMQLLDVSAASGLPHETDLLVECEGNLFLFEAKCGNTVARNDLLIFNQKCLDYWIRFIQLDETRPLYRIFVSKTALDFPLREFAYMWNIIVVEPRMLPIPTIIGILRDNEKCQDLEIFAADRHLSILHKGCRSLGHLFRRDDSKRSVICVDTEEMPYKGNLQISSDSMYSLHLQLSKKILKKFFNRSSYGYDEAVSRIEEQTGYTQEGKPK